MVFPLERFQEARPIEEQLSGFVAGTLWPRLREPLVEILVHFVVSILSVLSIASVEFLLYAVHLDDKAIPIFQWLGLNFVITLSDWMLMLEVLAATVVNGVGIVKAILVLVRS